MSVALLEVAVIAAGLDVFFGVESELGRGVEGGLHIGTGVAHGVFFLGNPGLALL